MKFEVDSRGFREMRALLRALPLQVERRIVDGAAKAAMRPMLATAKNNLAGNGSVATGATVKSLKIKSRKMRDGTRSTRIGPDGKHVVSRSNFYGERKNHRPGAIAHLIERGTKPHVIKARKGGMLHLRGGRFAKKVRHPGSAARPFMEPAFDKHKDTALKVYGAELFKRSKRWIERQKRA